MDKLKVTAEGRPGIWLVEREEITKWVDGYDDDFIHNYKGGRVMLGADWDKKSVVKCIMGSDKIAILTGAAQRNNLRHALSVITGPELDMFDIGEITEADLQVID